MYLSFRSVDACSAVRELGAEIRFPKSGNADFFHLCFRQVNPLHRIIRRVAGHRSDAETEIGYKSNGLKWVYVSGNRTQRYGEIFSFPTCTYFAPHTVNEYYNELSPYLVNFEPSSSALDESQ